MPNPPELAALVQRLQREGSLMLEIKVIPRARTTEIVGFLGNGQLKVKVAAVPEKGKANEALLAYLQQLFEVRADQVTLLSGGSSALKRVRINR